MNTSMFGKSVEVRPSPIHGLGLFATECIPNNTRIADYQGVEMSITEFVKMYGKDRRYTYSLGRVNRIVVGKHCIQDNPSHFCNESSVPNVCLKKRGLYTLVAVSKDEELCLKYNKIYPRDYQLTSPVCKPTQSTPDDA